MASAPNSAETAARQLEHLNRLLSRILPSNRFYTQKLKARSLQIASLEEFKDRVPFTTKEDLVQDQKENPPFGSNLTRDLKHFVRFHQTSGTTAAPLRWLDTPENWDWLVANWAEVFRAAEVGAEDRIYFAFSFGPFIGFWLAFDAAKGIGALCLPGGGQSSAARLRMLFDNHVTVLCCTPTYALRLAEAAREEGLDLRRSRVRKIIVAGEAGGSIDSTRQRIQELWPEAVVFDHHGMTEVGPVSYQCPRQPGILHVMEKAFFAEIIDPETTRPVRPGLRGELVLTVLGRFDSPLLRYRTGDIVALATDGQGKTLVPCSCGRTDMALAGGILGRNDDMVIVRGVNVFPRAVEEILRKFAAVREYQVRIQSGAGPAEMRILIETVGDQAAIAQLAREIEREFSAALNLRVPIELVAPGTLPHFEMKAHRWIHDRAGQREETE